MVAHPNRSGGGRKEEHACVLVQNDEVETRDVYVVPITNPDNVKDLRRQRATRSVIVLLEKAETPFLKYDSAAVVPYLFHTDRRELGPSIGTLTEKQRTDMKAAISYFFALDIDDTLRL